MARKRLSALAIEKLEAQIDDAMTDVAESAIFGICDMQKNVIKRLRMTATGVDDVSEASVIMMVYNKLIITLLHSHHHPTFNPLRRVIFLP